VQTLGATSKVFNYTYDTRRQLLTALATTSGYFSGTYTYGAGGRFASVNQSNANSAGTDVKPRNVNYLYGGSDPEQITALINVSGGTTFSSYSYDTQGNQVARCIGGPITNCTGIKTEYTYDGRNRLRRVVVKSNGIVQTSEEYWYDAAGQRTNLAKRSNAGAVTEMDWFIGDTEAHYDSSGTLVLAYANVSAGTPVARLTRTTATQPAFEYQFEGLAQSLLATVSQSSGTTNSSFSYSPFGEVIEATNAGGVSAGLAVHSRRYNDMPIDDASGLTYFGQRYYDRYSLTWTQADSLFRFVPDTDLTSPRKAALYTSDLNNPLRYEDPDGASPNLFVSFAPAEKLAVRAANYAASFVSLQRDGVESEGVIVDHYIGRELASNPIFNFFNSLDDSPGRGAAEPLGDDTAAQVFANAADHLENFGLPTGPPGSTPGGEPGSRAGKEFTGTAKKVIEENNQNANGGSLKCEICGEKVVTYGPTKRGSTVPKNGKQIDHVDAKSKGGSGTIDNAQVTCATCNNNKSDKPVARKTPKRIE